MSKKYRDLGFSKVDLTRPKVKGFPEVIFCQGKTPGQIAKIAQTLIWNKQPVLATRATPNDFQEVKGVIPNAKYYPKARIITISNGRRPERKGRVLVLTGGTGDIPVAEEAAITAEFVGARVERIYDVGVAGLHRLLRHRAKLRKATAIVVVAGMEGALASVVAGLTAAPVVAVPTSIGYGAHFKGIATLLSMLNACAPGVAVVNIDNGFGAGYFAAMVGKK